MALGIGDLSLWFEDIRKKGGFADTDALFNLGASQNPEFRDLPTYSDWIASGKNIAPHEDIGYERPWIGAGNPSKWLDTKAYPAGVAGLAYPSENVIEMGIGESQAPEATKVHEVLHIAFGELQRNPASWEDVMFDDPVDGRTKSVQSILYPMSGASRGDAPPHRQWNPLAAHDMMYVVDPRYPGGPVDTSTWNTQADYRERSGQKAGRKWDASTKTWVEDEPKSDVSKERARRMLEALNDATTIMPVTLQQAVNQFPSSPEESPESGLLSDKMSNEDWGKFVMGRGAEEERKTEVSKQKVEAKRQAQVAEVKKEKTKPSTVREAKAQGSLYFWDSKGNKKLALTAEDVKKFKASDKYDPEGKSTLTQMANIGKKEGIEGLLTTAPSKPKDVEVPKAEKKGYNFRNNWEKYYYAGKPKGDEYMEGFQERLSSKKAIPDKAKEAIEIAVDIFGGDKDKNGKRYSADRLRKDLQNIGRVESQYRKKESTAGGTEKGWWQVKPSTAKDALENAKKHFGKKFNKHFKKHGGYDGLLDRAKKGTLAALMLKDEELAAAFAAVQVIRTFDQE